MDLSTKRKLVTSPPETSNSSVTDAHLPADRRNCPANKRSKGDVSASIDPTENFDAGSDWSEQFMSDLESNTEVAQRAQIAPVPAFFPQPGPSNASDIVFTPQTQDDCSNLALYYPHGWTHQPAFNPALSRA